MPTLVEIGPSNASQGQHRRKDATELIKNLTLAGSRTPAFIVPMFDSKRVSDFLLFRCVLSSVLPLRSVGRSNFDKGRHNLTTLIHRTDIY